MPRILAVALWLVIAPGIAHALEVRQEQWGFDGTVVMGEFNPLTLYVFNEGEKDFRGELVLRKSMGTGPLGARLHSEPIYLIPESGRWVTFYPYITSRHHEWVVSWGRGRDHRKELGVPAVARPAAVYLWTDRLTRPPSGVRAMEAGRFPVTVGATSGLRAVVMDSVPDWDPAREAAFMAWLRAGGHVHLVPRSGVVPSFTEGMDELNHPSTQFHVGAGKVYRHDLSLVELDTEKAKEWGLLDTQEVENENLLVAGVQEFVFPVLQSIVRPNHYWPAIYAAAIAFLLIIGPVNAVLSRHRLMGYRGSLAVVCTAVIVFSLGFYAIGIRGYGKGTQVHKIAYAQWVGQGWDVTQYVNAFVVHGDRYAMRHEARHNLYATAQNHEAVRGDIVFAGGGAFDVDIPIYSWRSFVHRGLYEGEPMDVRVTHWPQGLELRGLTLEVGEGFPAAIENAWVLRGDRISSLTHNAEGVWISAGDGVAYDQHLELKRYRDMYPGYSVNAYYSPYYANSDPSPLTAVNPLIAHKLGVLREDAPGPLTGEDHVILFAVAPAGGVYSIRSEGFGDDKGYVVYRIDLFKPEQGVAP